MARICWSGHQKGGSSTKKLSEFNSDDHYIYYCGQESLRRNGVAIIVNKRVQNAVLGCNFKNDRMISVCFQGNTVNIMVIQVYAPTSHTEEAELEWFYEDLQDHLELCYAMLNYFSRVQLCATPSLGFSRQEHWSGLPFPSPMHESEK